MKYHKRKYPLKRVAEFVDSVAEEKAANRTVDRSVPMIKGENLAFAYGKDKVFEEFSFEIYRNEIVGLNWKSGEGKSTLINSFVDFIRLMAEDSSE